MAESGGSTSPDSANASSLTPALLERFKAVTFRDISLKPSYTNPHQIGFKATLKDKELASVFAAQMKGDYFEEPYAAIDVETDNLNQIHFGGIPEGLKGVGVGKKMYTALLYKVGYISCSIGKSSDSAQNVWASLVKDPAFINYTSERRIFILLKQYDERIGPHIRAWFTRYNVPYKTTGEFEPITDDDDMELDEVYSPENNKLMNHFRNAPTIKDFDVKLWWKEVCEIAENKTYLRFINVPNSPEDSDEMARLDPVSTWESLPEHFKKEIFNTVENIRLDDVDKHSPTSDLMALNRPMPLPRNTWLVHFTGKGDEIARNGFQIGFSDETRLGLTCQFYSTAQEKQGHGYNFGFFADDTVQRREMENVGYGKDVIMFQSSGVDVYHGNDQEKQVVFFGASLDPSNLVLIKQDGLRNEQKKRTWVVMPKQGGNKKGLYRGTISECMYWIKNNFQQYKRLFAAGNYDKQAQKIIAPPKPEPEPYDPGDDDDLGYVSPWVEKEAALTEIETSGKPMIGYGSESFVHDMVTRPGTVVKKMYRGNMKETMNTYSILKQHPELFSRVEHILPEKGVVVVEKLDVEKSKELGFDMDDTCMEDPKVFEAPRNVLYRLVNKQPMDEDSKYTLAILGKHYPDILKRLQFLGDGIRKLFPGQPIDFQFENMGFDKAGNLKFLDI